MSSTQDTRKQAIGEQATAHGWQAVSIKNKHDQDDGKHWAEFYFGMVTPRRFDKKKGFVRGERAPHLLIGCEGVFRVMPTTIDELLALRNSINDLIREAQVESSNGLQERTPDFRFEVY